MAYAEKHGKGWRVRYKQGDGTYGSEPGFPTKRAAKEWGEEQEAILRHNPTYDPRKAKMTLGEWAPTWMDAQKVAPGTVAKRRRLLNTHLLPEWEHTPINQINLFAAKAWGARQTCSPATVGHALTLLSMILTGAVDAGYLLGNPLFKRNRRTGRSIDIPQDEEIWAQPHEARQIGERLGGVAGLMVITAAWTGLRWGELAGLHRDNCLLLRADRVDGETFERYVLRIDPRKGALHEVEFELTDDEIEEWRQREATRIERAIQAGKTPRAKKEPKHRVELFLDPPKNRTSAREVDVPPFLVELLTRHLADWKHEFVFFTPGGQWWRRGNFTRQQLRPAADGRTALPASRGHAPREAWEPILPGFTMRGARHTHSTWMKDDRVDRALRFSTLGWAVADIEGTYEHVTPQMRQHRLEALQARWERAGKAAQAA